MNQYNMVVKDLRKYKGLKVFVQNAQEQIEILKKDIRGAGAITYDGVPGHTNDFHSSVENEVINRDEQIQELEKKIRKAQELIDRVDRSMDKVLNETARKILVMYYMDNEPWFKIAYEVSISSRHCKRIRNEAVKRLIPAFFGEE
jgi:DNA-directed RNA polymerase specialized sigma subunit